MEFFIKQLFEGKADELAHIQFKKFSRGEFRGRALVVAKKSGNNFSISTTSEYGNEFVRYFGMKLGEHITPVQGVVVSTKDLSGTLDFCDKKQFMGVKQYVINKSMSGKEIVLLCDLLPNAFFGLSFSVGESELKIKPKAPKSAKPSTKTEESPKVDFCKVKTNDIHLVKELIFDKEVESFKKIEIAHDFFIDEIVVDENLKKEAKGDFALIKEMAKRKGKIVRRIVVDEKKLMKETGFEA